MFSIASLESMQTSMVHARYCRTVSRRSPDRATGLTEGVRATPSMETYDVQHAFGQDLKAWHSTAAVPSEMEIRSACPYSD